MIVHPLLVSREIFVWLIHRMSIDVELVNQRSGSWTKSAIRYSSLNKSGDGVHLSIGALLIPANPLSM